MKIISLHFRNLNSLKGEFQIDFTTPALANAGLFAITGPTGSGKSTILDAITLALYSYTPRIGHITTSTVENKGAIVTKHTKDAFSHIVFMIAGKEYKAEWAISVNRAKKWGAVIHKLSVKEGDEFMAVTDKKSDTYNEVKKIVGLSEDQFTKAIVLSQGKFDEFLKAKKDERYALMEIITGTQIYREIGKKVYEVWTKNNNEIKSLNEKKDVIAILTDEQLLENEEKQKTLKSEIEELKNESEAFGSKKQIKIDLSKQLEEKSSLEKAITEINDEKHAFAADLLKIANHEKVLPLQTDVFRWSELRTSVESLTKEIDKENTNINEYKIIIERLIKELSEDSGIRITQENFLSALNDFSESISSLDTQIASLQSSVNSQLKPLELYYKQIPAEIIDSIKNFRASVEGMESYLEQHNKEIERIQLPKGINEANLDNYIETANVKIGILNQIVNQKSTIDVEKSKNISKENNLKNIENDIKQNNELLINKNKEKNNLDDEIKKLEATAEVNNALMNLEDYRNALKEGEPCPCCGSTNHPYKTNMPDINSLISDELIKKREKFNKIVSDIGIINGLIIASEKAKETTQKEIIELEGIINEYTKNFLGLCNQININNTLSLDEYRSVLQQHEADLKNVQSHQAWHDNRKTLTGYIELLKQYTADKTSLQNTTRQRSEKFGDKSIENYKTRLSNEWNTNNNNISVAQDKISSKSIELDQKNLDHAALESELILKSENMGFDSISALSKALLNQDEFNELNNRKNELEKKSVTISTKAEQNKKNIEQLQKLDDTTITLNDLEIKITGIEFTKEEKLKEQGGLQNQLEENRKQRKNYDLIDEEIRTKQSKQQYYHILKNLIGDQTGNTFNNIIQRITLRYLFSLTNNRLKTLMDRYQVDLGGKDDNEDEIWVIDTHMGCEKRTIDSVSGGERFVISLAMALSLSDLASNNVKIDSMFIDEGFGSLSPDDLDNAITMLERMQIENEKSIGIISHVESLKERIITQIQVKKLQNGESTLYLKSNDNILSLTA